MNRAQKRDEFIENLEKFRNTQGLSGTKFAGVLGVKQAQWDRWKQGRVGITLKNMRKLVECLNQYYGYSWKLADWLGDIDNLLSNIYKEGI